MSGAGKGEAMKQPPQRPRRPRLADLGVEQLSDVWPGSKPRDPERIDPLLEAFAILWKQFPDMRFGQLVANLVRNADLFGIEDDRMLATIVAEIEANQ